MLQTLKEKKSTCYYELLLFEERKVASLSLHSNVEK